MMEERERKETAEVRKKAAEAQAVLQALVGKQGVERERYSKEERKAWRRMRALGKGGNDHVSRHARNSEGNSRFPSREVPPHIDFGIDQTRQYDTRQLRHTKAQMRHMCRT
ncbi:hypothetical protein C8R46DRAFT_1027642 [Mycena filopes]|nr:hypothetical protein C8R46DRAFT_1027642 [Mycena filopes]